MLVLISDQLPEGHADRRLHGTSIGPLLSHRRPASPQVTRTTSLPFP